MPSVGLCAQLACIWEVTARKPGNVHRYCDFDDATYLDFILSAAAIAPILDSAPERPVGETVLSAIRATRKVTTTNTNLGIVLLLAPLAAVPVNEGLRAGLQRVLAGLSLSDTQHVYQAIRLAVAGGLGQVAEQDIAEAPTEPLRYVMSLAAGRDLIARQYGNGYLEIFDEGVPVLERALERTRSLEAAIISSHLHLMANHPDSLIARKRGVGEAIEAADKARRILEEGWPDSKAADYSLGQLDAWLRAEGHDRNPGTSADLVTACLFVALRVGSITLPPRTPWLAG